MGAHTSTPATASTSGRAKIIDVRSTPLLTEARLFGGYIVRVRFEDGVVGDVDFSYLLEYGGVFEPLHDPAFFAQLSVDTEGDTIVWPNDADIAPETLYERAREHQVHESSRIPA